MPHRQDPQRARPRRPEPARTDPPRDPSHAHPQHDIVVYDGDCGLCRRAAAFVQARDTRERFRFVTAQSQAGAHLLRRHGLDPRNLDTMLLVQGERGRTRSDATFAIARTLGFPWNVLGRIGGLLPRRARDAAYDFVARHRGRACAGESPADAAGEPAGETASELPRTEPAARLDQRKK